MRSFVIFIFSLFVISTAWGQKNVEERIRKQEEEINNKVRLGLEEKLRESERRQFVKDSTEKAAIESGDLLVLNEYKIDPQNRKRYLCNGFTIILISEISAEVMSSFDETIPLTIVIPTKVRVDGREYTVTKIGERSFYRRHVTSVTVPPTINEIKSGAFEYSNITSIALTDKLRIVGDNAFKNCPLKSVYLGKVTSIGMGAFEWCSSLETVVLSPRLRKIEQDTFRWCRSLKAIELPEGLRSIDSWAFSDCKSITKLVIPSTVERIGRGAFSTCSNLKTLVVSPALQEIDERAFESCPLDDISEVGSNGIIKKLDRSVLSNKSK